MEVDSRKLQELYIAYFGRPADPPGIQYWLLQAGKGVKLREIACHLYSQEEYKKSIIHSKSLDLQINQFYLNLFSRKVDFAGLSYWLRSIKSGSHDISDLACDLIESISISSQSENKQQIIDKSTLDNKVQSAELFSQELESTINGVGLYQPSSTNPWISGYALSVGVEFISQINSEHKSNLIDVKKTIQSIIFFSKSSNHKPVIEIEGVSLSIPVFSNNKKFTKILANTIKVPLTGGGLKIKNNQTSVQALSNLNVTFTKGERVALIGHNGSGKSTFLKLISGIYSLTSGKMKISVNVYPMLQKSFLTSNELSGIDAAKAHYLLINSNFNGFQEYLSEIVDFSGLGDYISLPIKTYSEGMSARLIFSLLTSCKHDCLAIDEGFGTGDTEFFERAEKRLKSFIDSAGTLFLASHSEELLRQFCTRGIVFNHGSIVYDGHLDEALNYYHASDYYENI
ncbi:ABC transporter ATP-binding protein [Prochlorococcus sp. MIT 1011]|uniref:ABC transporter ATP-binding protein n=1 Tax=Prochlorococcus sp. MIT 1011 TaxID=3082520 RepID=UPI0039B4F1AF